MPFKCQPQIPVDERQVANFAALPERGEVAPVVVLELNAGKLALAQTDPEQEEERNVVTCARLSCDQLRDACRRERSTCAVWRALSSTPLPDRRREAWLE